MKDRHYDVAIIGGGPAGSTAANYLARSGFQVCVIEKKAFPRETICGEFLSREVLSILDELGITEQFQKLMPNPLTSFRYSSEHDQSFISDVPFTAYGIKRGKFDSFLLGQAQDAGAVVYQPATVEDVYKNRKQYQLTLSVFRRREHITAQYVIAAFGKNSILDKTLKRTFGESRSRLNGVKFHVPKKFIQNVPNHEIQLYTARKMYCGVSTVDDATVTICFLEHHTPGGVSTRTRLVELMKANKQFAGIAASDFEESMDSFPFYGAGDIYFGKKSLMENGIFMIGDAAQVIAPLAGDGIGMAMENAKVIASIIQEGKKKDLSHEALAGLYYSRWHDHFRRRLSVAYGIQKMLLSQFGKRTSGMLLSGFPSLLSYAIQQTRGK